MNYAEEYQKAIEKGKTVERTRSIHTWEEEGQKLIGKVLAVEPFSEGLFETEVMQYSIDTDAGTVSTILGSATDKQLAKLDPVGQMICITYQGKKALSDGRHVNLFKVETFA